tara:strand:- start:523 stop:771 length:249 start_codon:yes stop_codon:yes gene_type:complete
MKTIAWYDQSNGVVSTDRNDPRFTPLGQLLPLVAKRGIEDIDYEKEWAHQNKLANEWFDLYQRSLDTMQILANQLRDHQKGS